RATRCARRIPLRRPRARTAGRRARSARLPAGGSRTSGRLRAAPSGRHWWPAAATPARSSPAPATACAGAARAATTCSGSFAREHVTQAAHGLDEVGAELLAQSVDVNLDRVAADLILPAVEFF